MPPEEVLTEAAGLPLTAACRKLGAWCLDNESELLPLYFAPGGGRMISDFCDALEAAIDTHPDREAAIVADTRSLAGLIDDVWAELHLVDVVKLRPLALLQALCQTPLRRYFRVVVGEVALEYGDPFPLPVRDRAAGAPRLSVHPTTPGATELLEKTTGFRLCRTPASDPIQVALDYSHRVLDAITWDVTDSPDCVGDEPASWGPVTAASIHPHASWDEFDMQQEDGRCFFVAPNAFDKNGILLNLEAAVRETPGARIAVLPELTLPTPDALGDRLAAEPGRYPALIVAGSAHVERDEDGTTVRRNESITYVHGARLLVTHKQEPFSSSSGVEDITVDPFVLRLPSDDSTRLAVLICADLQKGRLARRVAEMGVNLLLVPAMTPVEGAFPAGLGDASGYTQAIGIVANVVPPAPERPFLVMLARPFGTANERVTQYPDEVSTWKTRGMIYPWRSGDEAVTFRDWATA